MLRFRFLHHLFLLILLFSPWTSPCGISLLQSPEPKTELVVDPSGKVFLRLQAGKPIWSFPSGSPVYSSHQAPNALNNTENATEISRPFVLQEYMDNYSEATAVDNTRYDKWTMEDLFKKMPLVTDDGVILGSKTATAYLVDGISGRLIHVYKSTHSFGDNVKPTSTEDFVKLPLLITRTDSKLEHFDKTTIKLVWNVSVSCFRADLLCDRAFNYGGNKLGPEILPGIHMPMQCGSQIEVQPLIKSDVFIWVPRGSAK